MSIERTLILIKPDGVERGLVGEVLSRIERKGFTLVALELRTLDVETARAHYGEHEGKPFFGELVEFITSGPLVAGVIEGEEAIAAWRTMMGATKPVDATPARSARTSRRRWAGTSCTARIRRRRHEREIGLFFPGL
jgi:nucleoside-diphosphate kinase